MVNGTIGASGIPKGCSSLARDCRMVSVDDFQKTLFHCLTMALGVDIYEPTYSLTAF